MSDQPTVENTVGADITAPNLSNPIKSVVSIVLFLLWVVVMLPVLFFYRAFNSKNLNNFYMRFHKGVCWIFSIRCTIQGEVSTHKPTLFLSNHISYLDITVLGSCTPGYFIAKSEVANWPVFGYLAKLQNTLFFERKGHKVRAQLDMMSTHFDEQKSLILFPEGTSTDGENVEPFKSSLLQSVEHATEHTFIQPVTIAYTHHKNQTMDRHVRDHFAWYGEMPFGSHFFGAVGMGKSDVSVTFHPLVSLNDFATRKECAQYCFSQVKTGLEKNLMQ